MKKFILSLFMLVVLVSLPVSSANGQTAKYATNVKEMILVDSVMQNPQNLFSLLKSIPDDVSFKIPRDYDDASGIRINVEDLFVKPLIRIEHAVLKNGKGAAADAVLEKTDSLRQSLIRYIVAYRGLNDLKTVEERKAAFEVIKNLRDGYLNSVVELEKIFLKLIKR
ncbi:MAG: hypothetical protein AB1403_13980 [Candidatus Riflebacteria bacterium]